MKINLAREIDGGVYEVSAELADDEVKFLIEFALNHLLATGSMPYLIENKLAETFTPGATLN